MKNNLPATKEDFKVGLAKMVRVLRKEIYLSAAMIKKEVREDMKQMESRIIDHLDSFLTEIKDSREDREFSAYRISNHEDRIGVLEKKVGVASV